MKRKIVFFILFPRSAPEQNDIITLHIRSVGNWTNRLHQYFQEENEMIENEKLGIKIEKKGKLRS